MSPRAAMRRLISEIRADTGLTASVGIGPNRLVAKVASDAEKPQGFVVLTREQACERFAERAAAAAARHRPEDRRAAGGARDRHDRAARRDAAGGADRALRRPHGPLPAGAARASRTTRRSTERAHRGLGVARDARSRPTSPTAPSRSRCCGGSRARLCEGLAKNERRGRTIAIKVRLDDFTTVTRARTIPLATNDPAVVGDVALRAARRVRAAAPGAAARRARGGVRGGRRLRRADARR